MSPRPAILYTVIFATALPLYLWSRPSIKPIELQRRSESLLGVDSIDSLSISRGSEALKYRLSSDGKMYQVIEPTGKFIPQDLMSAMSSLLVDAKQVEVVAEDSKRAAEFGVDHPIFQIEIESKDKPQPVKISFGAENPSHSAIYAQITGSQKIFLLGKNIEYYQDLMFQWVEGKQGKGA